MTDAPDPITEMMDRVLGYCRSQGLATVARLGVPDALKDGPCTADELAERCGADAESLHRMLRALSVEGVFEDRGERTFALTPLSEGLTTDHPRSLRWFAASMCDEAHWRPWGKCYEMVVSGRSQTEKVLGASPWQYLSGEPEQAGRFGQAMSNMSGQAIRAITEHYDFSGITSIVDVGGSRGALLLALLEQHAGMRGTIFDLPDNRPYGDGAHPGDPPGGPW